MIATMATTEPIMREMVLTDIPSPSIMMLVSADRHSMRGYARSGILGRVVDKDDNDNNRMIVSDPGYLYYAEPENAPVMPLKQSLTIIEYTPTRQ